MSLGVIKSMLEPHVKRAAPHKMSRGWLMVSLSDPSEVQFPVVLEKVKSERS